MSEYYPQQSTNRPEGQQYPSHGVSPQGGNMPSQPHDADMHAAMAQQGINVDNELVRIGTPLITLITQIRHTVAHPNVASLRAQVIEEVKTFERKLAEHRYPMRTIVAARYCLCTAIDEAVMSQDWGTQSVWIEGSLLSIFQKETWGGERFYIILEDALRDIRNNIDFIEFVYFLLSLGFEGKYYGDEQRAMRDEIRNRIFYSIRHARAKPERNLSLRWRNIEAPASERQQKSTLKRMGVFTLICVVALFIFYNARVYNTASPTLTKLDNLATVSPVTTFSDVIERPIVLRDNEDGN